MLFSELKGISLLDLLGYLGAKRAAYEIVSVGHSGRYPVSDMRTIVAATSVDIAALALAITNSMEAQSDLISFAHGPNPKIHALESPAGELRMDTTMIEGVAPATIIMTILMMLEQAGRPRAYRPSADKQQEVVGYTALAQPMTADVALGILLPKHASLYSRRSSALLRLQMTRARAHSLSEIFANNIVAPNPT